MATTFKDVVKYGAYLTLQYDELHRGERFLVFLNGTQLKPDWVAKTAEQTIEEVTTAIEAINEFNFVIERSGNEFNILDDYRFGPEEFVWEVISLDGVVTEAMIERIQLLFFNLNAAFQEIKVFVESFSDAAAPVPGEGIVSLPTLNEVIVEFYGDRTITYQNSTFSELLTIINNEILKDSDSNSYVIQPFSVNVDKSFSVKLIITKLDDVAGDAEPNLEQAEDFVANTLAFHNFSTFWLQSTSERFVI